MKESCVINGKNYIKGEPIDISLPITSQLARAFGSAAMGTSNFISSNNEIYDISVHTGGQACNDYVRIINPHTLGTHTETVDHIASSMANPINTITDITANHLAMLLSVEPERIFVGAFTTRPDQVITRNLLEEAFTRKEGIDTVIIRTLPNSPTKEQKDWSGTNPVYFDPDAMNYLCEQGINHLIFDGPSVDKEDSDGKVPAHATYRKYNIEEGITDTTRIQATITELVYIPDEVLDGLYIVNLGVSNIQGVDAAPSRPLIYSLEEVK